MPNSLERGRQLRRVFHVLDILDRSHYGRSITEIHEEVKELTAIDVSRKTIDRDVKLLRDWGFSIEPVDTGDPKRACVWKLDKEGLGSKLNPHGTQLFSIVELLALSAASRLLFPLGGTPLWEGIQSFQKKLRSILPETTQEELERELGLWVVRGPAAKDYGDKKGAISTINRCIYQNRQLRIAYKKPLEDEPRWRLLEPYAILVFENSLYLLAIDTEDDSSDGQSPKHFKLDRIEQVEQTDDRFQPDTAFDPDSFYGHSIGIYHDPDTLHFRIRVHQRVAAWACEAPFHPQQTITPDGDGVILEFDGYFNEIVPMVLKLGKFAEVLEPAQAREHMAQVGKFYQEHYGE